MPRQKRFKTKYPGVYYVEGKAPGHSGTEKIYYIRYKRNGKTIEEKAGRQFQNDMTPARASGVRADRITGKQISNTEKRQELTRKASEWTIGTLWTEYTSQLPNGANRTDSCNWKKHLKPKFKNTKPKELVKLDTDRIRITLLKTKSPQTVKHVLALLRRIINYGIDQGHIAPIPFKISMPKVDNIKTEDLTHEELKRLLKVLETTPHETAARIMKIALYSGMRRNEIFKLRWNDIDLQHGFIHIREPKGGKSQKIPLNRNTRELLQAIPKQNSKFIFPARNGGPRKDISKDVNKIKTAAKLPKNFRPLHGLRHLYATMLASSGKVDMYTLQKLLTHKSPEMTQRYAHFRDDAMRRASDQVDNILSNVLAFEDDKKIKKSS